MPEKIIIDKDALHSYVPSVHANGRILVLKDKVSESGDVITDLFNSFSNPSIKNDTPISGVVVEIPDNVNGKELGISVGDRILSVNNKATFVSDQGKSLFLVFEDDVLAKLDPDEELDFTNMRHLDLGTEDDYYGFSK